MASSFRENQLTMHSVRIVSNRVLVHFTFAKVKVNIRILVCQIIGMHARYDTIRDAILTCARKPT